MKNIKNKLVLTLVATLLMAGGMIAFADKVQIADKVPVKNEVKLDLKSQAADLSKKDLVASNYITVAPLELVAAPSKYLNKNVKFKATFDKFSTLGLDYKPAYRDSQKYISFLIKRDDVTDHTIPLAEMKIFIKRSEAEKFIDLDSGDIIEVYGKVFSDALTDTWVEVNKLVVLEKKNKDKAKKA